jgi:hypothetical protein
VRFSVGTSLMVATAGGHSYNDMIPARMFAIASGREDCDDLDALRSACLEDCMRTAVGIGHRLDVATMHQPGKIW